MAKHTDYARMSLGQALALAESMSGRTRGEIAAAMGWPACNANRVFNSADDYWPSLPNLPRLCAVLGNTVLLDWAYAQALAGWMESAPLDVDAVRLLADVAALAQELGDVSREVRQSIGGESEDGRMISAKEARRIVRELRDLVGRGLLAISGLQAIADGEVRP